MIKWAIDVWEYDVKAAGKHFLESKGYKLSDDKDKYVIQVGLIFKKNKYLQEEFYNELKKFLIDSLPPDIQIIRFYVDEVVIDQRFEFPKHPYFTVKEKHIKFILLQSPTQFVKVYDDSVKISKSFTLQAIDLWNHIGSTLYTPFINKSKKILEYVRLYLEKVYPIRNYILKTKSGRSVIALTNLLLEVDRNNFIDERILDQLDIRVYHNLCLKYIRPLLL